MDQTLHKEREEIKRTTKQKMARRRNREGGNHLEQESNRQKTMEDIKLGLHPAVYGKALVNSSGRTDRCFDLMLAERPGNMLAYFRDGSTQTVVRAATLR